MHSLLSSKMCEVFLPLSESVSILMTTTGRDNKIRPVPSEEGHSSSLDYEHFHQYGRQLFRKRQTANTVWVSMLFSTWDL